MTHPSRYDPFQHAESLGVQVLYHDLPDGEFGRWYDGRRLVVLQPGLTWTHERCVLAHELGHAHYGHLDSSRKSELQADRFAAENLIDMDALRDVAATTQDEGRWCLELGVTVRLLRVFMYSHGMVPVFDYDAVARPSRASA